MDEVLYPVGYRTEMVTLDELKRRFTPHMHPEAARRGFAFIESKGGLIGIGSGYRAPGVQPNAPGFAAPGKSFHEGQQFPSGLYYVAWDMVAVNENGGNHRAPRWAEVPRQGTDAAFDFGVHMNVGTESWHMQPIELDGWDSWVRAGRPDLGHFTFRDDQTQPEPLPEPQPTPVPTPPDPTPIPVPEPPMPDPNPTPQPAPQSPAPTPQEITVQFTSRNLQQGASGPDVKFYQGILNRIAGQELTEDGQYGAKTAQAVKNWQTFFGMTVDGVMGPNTQRSLIEAALQH